MFIFFGGASSAVPSAPNDDRRVHSLARRHQYQIETFLENVLRWTGTVVRGSPQQRLGSASRAGLHHFLLDAVGQNVLYCIHRTGQSTLQCLSVATTTFHEAESANLLGSAESKSRLERSSASWPNGTCGIGCAWRSVWTPLSPCPSPRPTRSPTATSSTSRDVPRYCSARPRSRTASGDNGLNHPRAASPSLCAQLLRVPEPATRNN